MVVRFYEALLSREELALADDLGGDYFRVSPDNRDLNYSKFIDHGEEKITIEDDYNSHNAQQLNVEEMKELL